MHARDHILDPYTKIHLKWTNTSGKYALKNI